MFKRVFSRLTVGVIVTNAIRLLLIIEFINALLNDRILALAFATIAFAATFVPKLLARFGIHTGAETQIMILIIIYGSLFLGEVRSLFGGALWWDILLKGVAALALSFIGLTVVLTLENEELLDASPFMLILLSFSVSFMLGALWEIVEFSLDEMFEFNLQAIGSGIAAHDLIIDGIAALLVSIGGYFYTKHGDRNLLSTAIIRLMQSNPRIFRSRKYLETPSEKIKLLIVKGEGPKLEFKSLLRTNIHTGTFDKAIEFAILKTIVAYLNTEGGTLIVGVSDAGEILGLEKDAFQSNDKLKLHLNNMIKEHIGTQFMPFIQYELFPIDDKHVLKIDCSSSTKRVFLKENNNEEFYIRNGPSTTRLGGNALIDYISHRFRE